MNEAVENIGARRLQTVMEKLLEDVSFTAEDRKGETLVIDAAFVEQQLGRDRQERRPQPLRALIRLAIAPHQPLDERRPQAAS